MSKKRTCHRADDGRKVRLSQRALRSTPLPVDVCRHEDRVPRQDWCLDCYSESQRILREIGEGFARCADCGYRVEMCCCQELQLEQHTREVLSR